jgi:hypothetical protein
MSDDGKNVSDLRGQGLLAFWVDPQPGEHAVLYEHEARAFVFQLEGVEVLRIERDGGVLVHGRECGNDAEVFETVRRFFRVLTEGS